MKFETIETARDYWQGILGPFGVKIKLDNIWAEANDGTKLLNQCLYLEEDLSITRNEPHGLMFLGRVYYTAEGEYFKNDFTLTDQAIINPVSKTGRNLYVPYCQSNYTEVEFMAFLGRLQGAVDTVGQRSQKHVLEALHLFHSDNYKRHKGDVVLKYTFEELLTFATLGCGNYKLIKKLMKRKITLEEMNQYMDMPSDWIVQLCAA